MKIFQHFFSFLAAHLRMINKHLITLFLWDLFLQMKEKNSTIQFPRTSPGKVIEVSNSCMWYSTYILNALALREFLPIYTSICNKLWPPASAQLCCWCESPPPFLLPSQIVIYRESLDSAFRNGSQAATHGFPWEIWLIKGTIPEEWVNLWEKMWPTGD